MLPFETLNPAPLAVVPIPTLPSGPMWNNVVPLPTWKVAGTPVDSILLVAIPNLSTN